MVISKKFTSIFPNDFWKEIRSYIKFDPNTTEYSFNEDKLFQKGWIFAAIDDSSLSIETGELDKIINNTINISNLFYCLNLRKFLKGDLVNLDVLEFHNTKNDWIEVLSPFNEYTLWESALFDEKLTIFIIKPWSVGYNTLIGSKELLLKSICTDPEWIFNKKYPIYPI